MIEPAEIEAVFVNATGSALLLDIGLDEEHWIPLSVIEMEEDVFDLKKGDELTVKVKYEYAYNKGLV